MPTGPAPVAEAGAVDRLLEGVILFTQWLTIRSGLCPTRSGAASSNDSARARRRWGRPRAASGSRSPRSPSTCASWRRQGALTRVVEGRTHRLSLEPEVLSVAADWMDRQRTCGGGCSTSSTTTSKETRPMNTPPIVSPQEWEAAREELLVKEKELTRARDALAAERRRMPWMAVEKDYRFDGPDGPASLPDLFEGRRQLIVYRAFYAPDVTTYAQEGGSYPERACVGCSFVADQVAHPAHLNARDTTLAFVSRAPQAEIQGLKERMGWELIPWYTLTDDFDKDFGVDQWHGTQRLHPRRRADLPHLLRRRPRRRGDGQHLELPRHHRARPPGGSGRTRPRATRRPRRTSGGTTTTRTARTRDRRAHRGRAARRRSSPPRAARPPRCSSPAAG